MKIKHDGLFVYYNSSDELDEVYHLVCKCGHELYQHACTSNYRGILTVSQCTMCKTADGKFGCERFTYND